MMQTSRRTPRKFSAKRLSVRLLCLLAVIVLALAVKNLFWSPLPRGAYPVLSTARWAGRSSRAAGYPQHHWLPNGDLAYLETNANGMPQVCYRKMDSTGPIGPARPGPELPLAANHGSFLPSPDEQWVASVSVAGNNRYKTVLVSADGRTTRTFGELLAIWLPDSRSFLANSYSSQLALKICHLDSSHTEALAGMTVQDMPCPVTTLPTSSEFLIGGFVIHSPQLGQSQNYPSMSLRSLPAAHPGVSERTWTAHAPADMEFGIAYASPDDKHLLWVAVGTKPSPWVQWLRKIVPAWKTTAKVPTRYFLSDLRGSGMHPILNNLMGQTWNISPVWTPDSRHLSFIYKEQLYLVAVE